MRFSVATAVLTLLATAQAGPVIRIRDDDALEARSLADIFGTLSALGATKEQGATTVASAAAPQVGEAGSEGNADAAQSAEGTQKASDKQLKAKEQALADAATVDKAAAAGAAADPAAAAADPAAALQGVSDALKQASTVVDQAITDLGATGNAAGAAKVENNGAVADKAANEKGAAKDAAKGSAESAANVTASAESANTGATKDAAKSSAKDAAKGSAKDAAKGSAEGAANSTANASAEPASTGATKEAASSSAKDAAKGSAKGAANTAESANTGAAKNAAKGSAKGAAKGAANGKGAANSTADASTESANTGAAKGATNSTANTSAETAAKGAASGALTKAAGGAIVAKTADGLLLPDGRIGQNIVAEDFNVVTSVFKSAVVKGDGLVFSDIITFPATTPSIFDAAGNTKPFEININDSSIFTPQGGQPQAQFRRADLLPSIISTASNSSVTGKRTMHFSIQQDPAKPLALTTNEYQLAFLETNDFESRTFDVRVGTGTTGPSLDGKNIVVFGRSGAAIKELFVAPFSADLQNFAVTLDFDKNTMQVFHSTGTTPLAQVSEEVTNDNTGGGEYHFALLKLADAQGQQAAGIDEGMIFSGIFMEDSSDGTVTLQ